MLVSTESADPSWEVALRQGDAILWVGSVRNIKRQSQKHQELLQLITSRAWRFIYIDSMMIVPDDLKLADDEDSNIEIRTYISDVGPEQLPPNRLPIYFLRGPNGSVVANCTSDPAGLFTRYDMLRRARACAEVFAVEINTEEDVAGLVEAARLSRAFERIVVVTESDTSLDPLVGRVERLIHWRCETRGFVRLVTDARSDRAGGPTHRVLFKTSSGKVSIDLTACIDPGYPITDSFELIDADEILAERSFNHETLLRFLEAPSSSWLPYAIGMPYPRQYEYEHSLLKYLKKLAKEGPSHTATAWIAAEDGSGATTTLRQLCFDAAREGFPTLVAKPQVLRFDFKQLSSFLARAADRLATDANHPIDVPWIIAFDAQHTQLHTEFISGLASGLKQLLRSAVVVAIQPIDSIDAASKYRALGNNKNLGAPLSASVSIEEGVDVGRHLCQYLPKSAQLADAEWRSFISDTVRISLEGTRSLFWVALRFWLQRVPGVDHSLRKWLASKLATAVADSKATYSSILEIAVLSKHRIAAPFALLESEGQVGIRKIALDSTNALGLDLFRINGEYFATFMHPLIAEEAMRIAHGDIQAFEAIEMPSSIGLLDFELHLLGRLIRRPAAGSAQCLDVVEELVTSALRVDPREAPRNYEVRDQIVRLLEEAPDAVWDVSQVFNHHVAKARRHLASTPPHSDWSLAARIEQCELAVKHIRDAMSIQPRSDDHRESELNLQVSLALTFDVQARLEEEAGNLEHAVALRKEAESAYVAAQRIDADNSYVLENYARFKIRQARGVAAGEGRTRLIVDAIVLLELERSLDDTGHRDLPTLEELATAYGMLHEDGGQQYLGKLAAMGSEAALVAIARMYLRRSALGEVDEMHALEDAENVLRRVNPASATWVSFLTHYQVVSQRRPYDFLQRLELLEELAADSGFVWPQQMRMEFGILLFQVGDPRKRARGADLFRELRDDLGRSGALHTPSEMKFLRDPATSFQKVLRTSIEVKRVSEVGRSSFGIPHGWGTVEVAFRDYRFGRDRIRIKDELDCLIQFTNFGPQAVPVTMEE